MMTVTRLRDKGPECMMVELLAFVSYLFISRYKKYQHCDTNNCEVQVGVTSITIQNHWYTSSLALYATYAAVTARPRT